MSRLYIFVYLVATAVLLLANEHQSAYAGNDATANALPGDMLKRHMQFPGCIDPADPIMAGENIAFRAKLDEKSELVGILCEPDDVNRAFAVYLVRDGYFEDAERLYFADYSLDSGWTGSSVLYNPVYDKAAGLLKGFSKSRALGDCGSQASLKWDGEQLNLVEYRYKADCDENLEQPFPLLYKRHLQPQ